MIAPAKVHRASLFVGQLEVWPGVGTVTLGESARSVEVKLVALKLENRSGLESGD